MLKNELLEAERKRLGLSKKDLGLALGHAIAEADVAADVAAILAKVESREALVAAGVLEARKEREA